MSRFWACAQLETHRERLALHFLELNGFTTYAPRIRAQRMTPTHRESPRGCSRATRSIWIELQWHAARWAPGVIRLVCSGGTEPARVPPSVIDDLKSRESGGYVVLPKVRGLERGDKVKITVGPFANHLALFDGMRGSERVLVQLALLGSTQRVELARSDIARVLSD
jgi:transcriptional antiterminator RfaH